MATLDAVTITTPPAPPGTVAGSIPTGAAGRAGVATLVAGTVTVSTTAVTAASVILLTIRIAGGLIGEPTVSAQTAATSFVITSVTPGGVVTQAGDTSTVNWLVIN
jgi:hypothetical protein